MPRNWGRVFATDRNPFFRLVVLCGNMKQNTPTLQRAPDQVPGEPASDTASIIPCCFWACSGSLLTLTAAVAINAVVFHSAPVEIKQMAYLASAILAVIVAVLVFGYLGFQAVKARKREGRFQMLDPMTGLLNRCAFSEAATIILEDEAGRAAGKPAALLMINVDGLRQINEKWGNQAGDQALAEIAAILRQSLRHDDIAARLSGDEFGLVIPRINESNARYVADRLRRAVANLDFRPAGRRRDLTISTGLVFARGSVSFDAAYQEADRLVRLARRQGGNRICASALCEPEAGACVQRALAAGEAAVAGHRQPAAEVNAGRQASFTLCVG